MSDPRREYTIEVRVAYALWPGDGVFCMRISGREVPTQFVLVDRENRRHDLEPY